MEYFESAQISRHLRPSADVSKIDSIMDGDQQGLNQRLTIAPKIVSRKPVLDAISRRNDSGSASNLHWGLVQRQHVTLWM